MVVNSKLLSFSRTSKGNKTEDDVTTETKISLILIIELNLNDINKKGASIAYQRKQTENSGELK